ncbi:MAG: hypothetical protein ACK4RS_06605 [Thiothrix sp.]
MKNQSKIKALTLSAGLLLCLSVFSTTASADYQGYWVDVVRDYQSKHSRDYQRPTPAADNTLTIAPPVLADTHQQPPASTPAHLQRYHGS